MANYSYIAIDFDASCVTHEYPIIGQDIGAAPVLKKLIENGHKLILFTMRSGNELQEAVDWFGQNEIPLFGINNNPTQKLWTSSPKAYANLYIDDASLNAPLKEDREISDRPFLDWVKVEEELKKIKTDMKEQIEFAEFLELEKKLEIRIGTIKFVERVPKSNKLLHLTVSFGDVVGNRAVVTNIGDKITDLDDLRELQFPFIMNLKPVSMMGVISQAMIMVGESPEGKIEIERFSDGSKLL